jgi:glyoxylase-like metal-dependent hydrolase (beta-lactamase superfamily II)
MVTRAFISYAIKGGKENVLVDTGPPDLKTFEEFDERPYQQSKEEKLETALKKRTGWSFEDVDIIINTHMHPDHCWNNELFHNARIFIQGRELRQAAAPLPHEKSAYYLVMEKATYTRTNTRLIDGDYNLTDDIRLLLTPGHSWGHQSVMVESGGRCVLIAGDMIVDLRNWEKGICPPITSFPHQWYRSLQKLKALEPDIVLPGHDMRAFKNEYYP